METRLSFEPIFALAGTRNVSEIARRLGRDQAGVRRYANDGLTPGAADDFAIKLGAHPSELWPEWDGLAVPEKRGNVNSNGNGHSKVTTTIVELVPETPPVVEKKGTLIDQVVGVVQDGHLQPATWYRVALLPSDRSAKALSTKMTKHELTKRMKLEWTAAECKVFVRGPS
jgi:hypothetical protein